MHWNCRKAARTVVVGGFVAAALLLVGSVPKSSAPRRELNRETAVETARKLVVITVSAERTGWDELAQRRPYLLLRSEAVREQ